MVWVLEGAIYGVLSSLFDTPDVLTPLQVENMRGHNQKYQTQLQRPINESVGTLGLCYAQNLQFVAVTST